MVDPSFATLPAYTLLVILIAGLGVTCASIALCYGLCCLVEYVGSWLRFLRERLP